MKKSPIAIALAAALSLGASAPVLAEMSQNQQDTAPSAQQQGGSAGGTMQMDTNTQMQHDTDRMDSSSQARTEGSISTTTAYNPKDYDGKDVVNAKGDKVGEVEKLVINTGDQQVYAVVGVGGFLGIGEKDVAIPLEQLQPQGKNLALSSGVTEDELKSSMKYNESEFSAFEPEQGDHGKSMMKSEPIERDTSAPKSNY